MREWGKEVGWVGGDEWGSVVYHYSRMKPYLTPNPTLAFIIEWVFLIVSILLVFSPFLYLGIRKWRRHLSVNWKQVIGAYLVSFAIYPIWDWWLFGKVDRWIYESYINTHWLQNAFLESSVRIIPVLIIVWPLLIFYSNKLVKEKIIKKDMIILAFVAIGLFILLLLLLVFMIGWSLTTVGSQYF